MKLKNINRLVFILATVSMLILSGCYSHRVHTIPTKRGYVEQIKAHKRISKQHREYERYEKARKRKIKKMQQK